MFVFLVCFVLTIHVYIIKTLIYSNTYSIFIDSLHCCVCVCVVAVLACVYHSWPPVETPLL